MHVMESTGNVVLGEMGSFGGRRRKGSPEGKAIDCIFFDRRANEIQRSTGTSEKR